LACVGGQVPGKQSVPRAELRGAVQTLIRADPNVEIEIGIDASYVTNGVHQRDALCNGANGDLWSMLFEVLDERQASTHFLIRLPLLMASFAQIDFWAMS
jgi:hypothetical protein